MCGRTSPLEPEPSGREPAQILCHAIEREREVLFRRLTVLVYRVCGRLRREEVEERVNEVLQEAWRRALEKADTFDPSRSATAWILGFALRILQEQRRASRRTVIQSDLGDAAWRGALERLCTRPDTDAKTIKIDLEQKLARLDERHRLAIRSRYNEGLDGEELACALNAPTAGAARVRVARALQALRAVFGISPDEESHD